MQGPSFSELWERASREPAHRQVAVAPISIDLSPQGILDRLQKLMDAAKVAGQLGEADHQQFTAGAQQLRALFGRLDTSKLAAAWRADPKLGFRTV